ncbi:MAG TPA: LamG-like jellyroll fold domain-containing protein [Verrucomicrobiae bacterium]|nr:LamG-like jellyroll fold domain-containing protein [Verrucomicrobiae bacterium]
MNSLLSKSVQQTRRLAFAFSSWISWPGVWVAGVALTLPLSHAAAVAAPSWTDAITASAPKYWYRFEETDNLLPVPNEGSANGWDGVYGPEITTADNLGRPSVIPALGNAIEFTGPSAGNGTGKYVDLAINGLDAGGNPIADPNEGVPELINLRPPAVDKTSTVEYWIKTTQRGSTANQTWTSPALLANESPGDGDMYWGWITDTGDFGFSTSDIVEIYSRQSANREVTDGKWHHVVLVKEWHVNSVCVSTMYLDGGDAQGGVTIVRNTGAGTTSYQDSDGGIRFLGFTQHGGGGDVQFIGLLDELVIYDRALTATEVGQHYLSVTQVDSDGDGMPDYYEIANGLNPAVNDAAADPDNDGSSNLREYQQKTDPHNPDTDGDGLKDGVETGTGVWVSPNDRGTNPLNPDTDGDGLRDDVETNTGIFVNASNTGTSPLKRDSDGDTYDDAGEVLTGSDPNDRNSLPPAGNWPDAIAASAPKYWYRFEETDPQTEAAVNQGSAIGFDGAYGPGLTSADNLGKPSVLPVLGHAIEFTGPNADATTGKYVDLAVNGTEVPELTNFRPPTVDKTTTVEYWIRTSQRGSADSQTWNSPSVLAHESGGDGDMYWGWITDTGDFGFSTSDIAEIYSNHDANKNITDGQWHHIVLIKEWHVLQPCVSTLYIDGGTAQGGATIVRNTPAGTASYQDSDGGIRYLGFTQSGGSGNLQFIGLLDELAIYDRALTEAEVRRHFRSVYEADTDGDGMPDAYEISNGLNPLVNDANLDADNDGLTNIQEYHKGTNPQNPDTDGDGAKDGVETGTGVWVSANDRGTDPLNPDSDGDGLLDGVETNTGTFVGPNDTGTNPNLKDTDNDGYKDADEIALGSNPSNPASKPSVKADWVTAITADQPQYFWRFEDPVAANGVLNEGLAPGFNGSYGPGILDTDLGKPSAAAGLGTALEFRGPQAGTGTDKYVDFGADIPELVNLRTAPEDGKATTVEYWIKTTQRGSTANQTWTSPAIFGHESGGDGDMYWGWIDQDGQLGLSTSDIEEINADGVTDGNWHHVVLVKVWNQEKACLSRMYIDGGALGGGQSFEATTSGGNASQQDDDGTIRFLGFVQTGGGGDLQYIGQIDEVAIYNKALTEAQARLHYLAARYLPPSFRITRIAFVGGTRDVSISWQSTIGVTYRVQRAAVITGPWDPIAQVTATDGTTTFIDPGRPATDGASFYRVLR